MRGQQERHRSQIIGRGSTGRQRSARRHSTELAQTRTQRSARLPCRLLPAVPCSPCCCPCCRPAAACCACLCACAACVPCVPPLCLCSAPPQQHISESATHLRGHDLKQVTTRELLLCLPHQRRVLTRHVVARLSGRRRRRLPRALLKRLSCGMNSRIRLQSRRGRDSLCTGLSEREPQEGVSVPPT